MLNEEYLDAAFTDAWGFRAKTRSAMERDNARMWFNRGVAAATASDDSEHPAHTGHRFGGGYARASAMLAGDPDWMNATGGEDAPAAPPTDDVRESLAEAVKKAIDGAYTFEGELDPGVDDAIVAALTSDPRFEVRPREPEITDAEVEAASDVLDEAGATVPNRGHVPDDVVRAQLEAARKASHD